jgi:hypothetical protein
VPLTVVTEVVTVTFPVNVAPSRGAVMHSRMLYAFEVGPLVAHGVPAASTEVGARGYGRTWATGVRSTMIARSQPIVGDTRRRWWQDVTVSTRFISEEGLGPFALPGHEAMALVAVA